MRFHARLLSQALLGWAAFWLIGLPAYYQQYPTGVMGAACVLLSVAISFAAVYVLSRVRRDKRREHAFWIAVYFTVPFAILDTLYCGIYLQRGWWYLAEYWYLTVFYVTPWLTFPPTAALLTRLEQRRNAATEPSPGT